MSQNSKLVFDWKEAEESIVWNIYREAEYKKFRAPANDEEGEDIESLPWYHRLFRPLYRTNRRTTFLLGFDNEPFLLIRKYIIWIQKSKWRIEDAKIVDPMALHRFFTNKIRNIAVFGLFTNIVFLFCLYSFANDKAIIANGSPLLDPFFATLRGYISTWMVCNALCIFHFIVLMNISRIILRQWNIDADYMWLYLGRFVAFLRILIICQHTIYYLTENEEQKCYGLHIHSLPHDKRYIFWYVFCCSMLDGIQGIVLSCMPFRWPWALVFSLLMMYQISMRTLTCFVHIEIPDEVRHKVTQGLLVFAAIFFLMNVALVSYTFQRSLLASFSNTVSVSELAKSTRAMVNMLCTDVKLNVRQVLKMLQNLSQVSPPSLLASPSFTAIVNNMKESGTVINVAVDHLLFLAKVGEGRFEFSLMDRINLSTTLVEVCKDYKRKVTVDHRDVDLQVEIPKEIITTDTRCFHALAYYGLMAVDTLVQSFQSKDNMDSNNGSEKTNTSKTKQQQQEPPHFLIRGHLEEATAASPPEVVALRIIIHFNLHSPTNVEAADSKFEEEKREYDMSELKKLVSNNGLIHSCCIVCNRLVQSYGGEFQFYHDRLEFTLPVLPTERLYRPHQDSNGEEPGTATTVGGRTSHHPQETHFTRANSLTSFLTYRFARDKDGGIRFNTNNLFGDPMSSSIGVTGVPLSELLQKYASLYFTVPQMESLVTDAIRALLKHDLVQLMTYHVLNSVDMKIRAVIFVQTWEAQQELIQAGFTGDIILCSEKVSYLDTRERNLFSFVLPLPPSQQDLRLLTRFLRQKLEVLEIIQLKKQVHPDYLHNSRSSIISGRNSARDSYPTGPTLGTGRHYNSTDNTPRNFSEVHPECLINNQVPINGNNYMFTTAGASLRGSDRRTSWLMYLSPSPRTDSDVSENISIRLSPPLPTTLFAELVNFGTFPVPPHQLNNYAKWRFMNPGDIFHHTTNTEFFSFFMIVLLTYQYISGLGSVRTVAGSLFFGVVLLYRNSVYMTFERFVPYVVCWTIVSLIISVLSMTVSFSSMQQIWMKQMQYTSVQDLFENTRQVESAINNGLHVVFNIVLTPILLKYYGDYLTWPFSFFAIITQLCRAIFYAVYMLDPFLTGLNRTIFITLIIHIFAVLLINVVSIEGLFRDEFLQLHDLILARSYLEKCLVLTRQLIQPLENMVDAQEATVQTMVNEAVAGRLWMQEPMISAMNECQVAKLTTHQWMLELRLTKASWLMQQERSEILGHMRAVLLRHFVLSMCRQIVDDYHSRHAIDPTTHIGNFSFAVRVAPELTQIRVDESLCRATVTHICRHAIQQIERHVHLARRMCRIYRRKRPDHRTEEINSSEENNEDNSNNDEKSSSSKTVQYWKKQALMQHNLLLCVYPKSDLSPETGRPFRFADVRDMEVLVLSTAEHEDFYDTNDETSKADLGCFVPVSLGGCLSGVELKKVSACSTSQTHSGETGANSMRNGTADAGSQQKFAADIYAEFFAFTNNRDSFSNNNIYKDDHDEQSANFVRRSTNYEDGVVCRHGQYRSYHRVLLPYLLTPYSSWFAEAIISSSQFHTRAMVNQIDVVHYFSRDERRQRHYANYMRQSSTFFLPALAAASASSFSDPSHAHSLFRSNSNNTGLNMNYPLKSKASPSSPTASFVNNPKATPFSSLNSITSSQNKSPLSRNNAITFRTPGMKVAVVLSFADTFLRRQAVHNQVALGAVGWLGRLEMLKPPLMPQSCFLEAECIFIEYMSGSTSLNAATTTRANIGNGMYNMVMPVTTSTCGADRYFAGETEEERIAAGREYLRLVVQWLRYGGYEGVIVFLGDSTMKPFMQQDTALPTRSSWATEMGDHTLLDVNEQFQSFRLYHEHNQRVLRSDQDPDTETFKLMMKRNVLNQNNHDDDKNNKNSRNNHNANRIRSQISPVNSASYQHTAALADCYLTTPLTEEKLRSILPECERRLVELALGVWNP